MTNSISARRWTVMDFEWTIPSEEPASWQYMIDDIHRMQHVQGDESSHFADAEPSAAAQHILYSNALICFTRKTRSWDLMPPEIVRPVASTTIGCLINMVHRMDLTWVIFKPDEVIIRATGHKRSISPSRARGLGVVVEYVRNTWHLPGQHTRRIPTEDADKVREFRIRTVDTLTITRWLPGFYLGMVIS
jgi:hypothetical protein